MNELTGDWEREITLLTERLGTTNSFRMSPLLVVSPG